jgi:GTPase SAR1 family protein
MNFSDKIKNKNEAMGKKSMASILKVNKYENPQAALDLVAHICTSDNHIDVEPYFSQYSEKVDLLNEEISNGDYRFENEEFIDRLKLYADYLQSSLMNNSSNTIKIAVAGGFSSGKSSLLNYLTRIGNKLPTGIEPVSVVNTYLTCNKSIKSITVKGVNLKNQLVLLNDEVLSCIQHSSKSKVYIASILKKLLLDIPSDDLLNGFTFIDTPGYNNSLGINVENDATDRQTALTCFNEADVLFWCVDIEAGTISVKDLEMIDLFTDGPVILIFTKMDKKPHEEVVKIINAAVKLVEDKFDEQHKLLDVFAISTTNNEFISNSGSNDIYSIFKKIKFEINKKDNNILCLDLMHDLFQSEYDASYATISDLNKQKSETIEKKENSHKDYIKVKDGYNSFADSVKEIIVDNYDEVLNTTNSLNDLCSNILDSFSESLDRESEWNDKSGFFSDTSDLIQRHSDGVDAFNSLLNQFNKITWNYYDYDDRNEKANIIKQDQQQFIDQQKELYDSYVSSYNDIVKSINSKSDFIQLLKKYENKLSLELSKDYKDALSFVNNKLNKLQTISNVVEYNIFDAISSDSLSNFLSCFSKGVDLTVCNKEGFSPLTWAVKSGNNEMVKFFLNYSNVIDLSQKDKRGFSALETAIIYHFQDICTLLIDKDKSLLNGCRSVKELSNMNNFTNWICQF